MNRWKKQFRIALGSALLLLGSAAALNWCVDSSMAFGRGDELRAAADTVSGGGMVEGPGNYDHGKWMARLITHAPRAPETIAVGSSRTFFISAAYLGLDGPANKGRFLNAGVADAAVGDMMGIIGIFLSMDRMPRRVIITADPWTLATGAPRWASLDRYYRITQRAMGGEGVDGFIGGLFSGVNLSQYALLLNADYTRRNLEMLFKPRPAFRTVDAPSGAEFGRMPDNSLFYPKKNWDAAEEDIRRDAQAWLPPVSVSRANIGRMQGRERFERFVRYLKGRNVEVTLLLAPFNPAAYAAVSRNTKYEETFAAADEYFRAFGVAAGVRVAGSYDPAALGLGVADFFDGVHPKNYVYEKLLAPLR